MSQMNKTKCVVCGKSLRGYRTEAKYCGDKCRAKEAKDRYNKYKEEGRYDHVTRERFAIFQRDGFRCIYCGRSSIEDNIKLHLDHLNPKTNGGDNAAMNLVTSCTECNLSKSGSSLSSEEMVRITSVIMERNVACGLNNMRQIATNIFKK